MPDSYFSQNEYSFVWDSDKEAINIKKHGIAFRTAARVFEDEPHLGPASLKNLPEFSP